MERKLECDSSTSSRWILGRAESGVLSRARTGITERCTSWQEALVLWARRWVRIDGGNFSKRAPLVVAYANAVDSKLASHLFPIYRKQVCFALTSGSMADSSGDKPGRVTTRLHYKSVPIFWFSETTASLHGLDAN